MALRLHEVHPSIVHFPLALVPVALGLDALGMLTGRRALCDAASALMPVAAGSTLLAGAAGLVAQESVNADGRAHDVLVTHRNLNIGLATLVTALAAWRAKQEQPTSGYLLAGLAGVIGMNYTAYLGGKMVYSHGVGVEPAGGVRQEASPAIEADNLARVARTTAEHAVEGVRHIAREVAQGEIAPALGHEVER